MQPTAVPVVLGLHAREHVWSLVARNAQGDVVAHLPWAQVLQYEQHIRKNTWQLVQQDHMRFHAALKLAIDDPVVKERYFTTPLALASLATRQQPQQLPQQQRPQQQLALPDRPQKQARKDGAD